MRRMGPHNSLGSTLLILLVLHGTSFGGDWPQWRGHTHDGHSEESSNYPQGWPPQRLWTARTDVGCTSPVVADGKCYVLGYHGAKGGSGEDRLACHDLRTGRVLWRQAYPARYQSRLRTGDTGAYGGPSATPVCDPETRFLYTLGVDGELHCWDTAKEGRTVWRMNLHDVFKIRQRPKVGGGLRDYGFTAAPFLHGDWLLVEVGATEGTVVAFDKRTGKQAWKSEYRGAAGHSGGFVPLRIHDTPALALLTLRDLVLFSMKPESCGKTLGTYGRTTHYGCNIPTPVAVGTKILLTSGYNHKSSELASFVDAAPRRVWKTKTHTVVSTPVVHGQRAYLIAGRLQCIDVGTGKRLWAGGSFRHGTCLLTADDKLIVYGNRRLALVDAVPDATSYRELSRVDAVGTDICYPHVAYADGVIVCKDKKGLINCFSTIPH